MNGDRPTPLNMQTLCQRYQISAKGIIHIGAHEGQELAQYLTMTSEKVLLIEANPQIFLKLEALVADIPNVTALSYAICDHEGNVNLRLNAYDFSSSILPLKHHRDIYPNMLEVGEVTVQAKTLDRLLEDRQFISSEFNILVLDIQGAELLALTGAQATLKNIDAIYTEVNFQELYVGCALIEQIDKFLSQHSFQRVALKTPFHASYGDAFYVKTDILSKSQTTILTSIAPGNLENQRLALQSWQVLGFKVISLNNSSEVIALQSLYPHITFHAVSRDAELEVGKPLIYLDHIWEYLQNACVKTETGNGIFGIINSDIHLKVDFDDLALIEHEAKQSLVVSSRIEVENPDQTTGRIYTRGFDAFFFDADLLAKLPKSNYCLGMPWWDFWLPLIAQQQSVPIKYLTTPIAYHVQHRINYRSDLWERFGIQFASLLQPDLARSLTERHQPGSPALRQQLICLIDTFLQSFHHHAQRLKLMSVNHMLDSQAAINREAAELHVETGDIYREQSKFAEAIASYQKALSHDPNYALAYLGLLKIYLSEGMSELATEAISTIQALQPEVLNADVYIQLSKVLAQKGKYLEAIEYLQQSIHLTVADDFLVESYLSLGDIYLNHTFDFPSAILNYQQAIAIQPKSAKAHWQLAQAFQQQSLVHQQEALDLEPHLAGSDPQVVTGETLAI
jgi:FkbM family methyltransferase